MEENDTKQPKRGYAPPPVVWIKLAVFMHGYLRATLGGEVKIGKQRVICVQHLPGVKKVWRMETVHDMMAGPDDGCTMSDERHTIFTEGMKIDAAVMARDFNMTPADLAQYIPVEVPKLCVTENGVLRPWTASVNMGAPQSSALRRILRREFWTAVDDFSRNYRAEHVDEGCSDRDVIDAFCEAYDTPTTCIDAIRREWQRREI